MDNFYVTLPSNAMTDVFPNNSGGHYRTMLAQEISLNSSWEVGLSEIIYVSDSFDNVRDGENCVDVTTETPSYLANLSHLTTHPDAGNNWEDEVVLCKTLTSEKLDFVLGVTYSKNKYVEGTAVAGRSGGYSMAWTFTDDSWTEYYTHATLAASITKSLETYFTEKSLGRVKFDVTTSTEKLGGQPTGFISLEPSDHNTVTLTFSKQLQQLLSLQSDTIVAPDGAFTYVLYTIQQSIKLSKQTQRYQCVIKPRNYESITDLINEINSVLHAKAPHWEQKTYFSYNATLLRTEWNNATHKETRVQLSDTMNKTLGFTQGTVFGGEFMRADNAHNLHFTLPTMWIYSNIAAPVAVGDSQSNLLRIVPVENNGRTVVKTYERPHYLNLSINSFHMIEIMIHSSSGVTPIKFRDHVIIKLHFRKKKSIQL